MPGLAGNLSDLTVASPNYDILLCSKTLVSDMRDVSEVLVPGFSRPVLLCRGKMPREHGMAAYVRDGYVAPIGNSDRSSLSAVISMVQAVPNLCGSRKVFLKHQVNWSTVCGAIRELPWRNIWLSEILLRF